MSNFENMKLLIQEISGTGERTMAISKSFLEFTGSLEEGVFLSQVIYFSDKSSRSDGYFWKSYDEWKEHTFMTEYTLRKQVKALKEKGYLETALKKAYGAPTLHYKFNMEKFTEDFIPFLRNRRIDSLNSQNGNFDIAESLTKSTTKITNNLKDMVDSEESTERSNIDIQFEEWWNIYGRKTQKPKALTAFKRIVKKHGYEQLKKDTETYIGNYTGDPKYKPYPATFLNGYNPDDERFIVNNSYNNNNTQQNQTAIYQKEVKVEDLYNGGEWD